MLSATQAMRFGQFGGNPFSHHEAFDPRGKMIENHGEGGAITRAGDAKQQRRKIVLLGRRERNMGLLSHSQQHGNHRGSPKDLPTHIRKPGGCGSLQLPLNLLVPFLGKDFLLALKGIDFSPDQPMGFGGGEPAVGFSAGVPFAALQLFSPMGFHFG